VGRHTKVVLSFDELKVEIVRGVRSSPDGFILLMTAAKWLSHYPSPIFVTAFDGFESGGGAEHSITTRGFSLLSNELSKRGKAGEVDVAMPDTSYRKGGYGNTAVSLDLVCDVAYGFNNRELYLLIRETQMAQTSEIEAVKSLFKNSNEILDGTSAALGVSAQELAVIKDEPEAVATVERPPANPSRRVNYLTPIFDQAIKRCNDNVSAAAVWEILQQMAKDGNYSPLGGLDSVGITYKDASGEPKSLTYKNVQDRISRLNKKKKGKLASGNSR
jgi:hypothetical protein